MSDEFRTPVKEIFEPLNEVTPFFWDAACNKDNCLVNFQKNHHLTDRYDYLTKDLRGMPRLYDENGWDCAENIFINPPYSRGNINKFIAKAWDDAKHFRVVLLVKADMSTDWFNYPLEESTFYPVQINQQDMTIKDSYNQVIKRMEDGLTQSNIGILHLRKRIKFYVSEGDFVADCAKSTKEEFKKDRNRKLKDGKVFSDTYRHCLSCSIDDHQLSSGCGGECAELIETKNYKRVSDGIVSKSGANFPSMVLVFDRRHV